MAAFVEAAPAASQHMQALERANAARLAGAGVKKDVREGRLTVRAALYMDTAGSLTVLDLLMSQRRWGRTRALKVLSATGGGVFGVASAIPEQKRVRDLTERQRHALARATGAVSPPTG